MGKICFLSILLLCAAVIKADSEFITVYKDGNDFFVRSAFSGTEDIIIHNWRYANEKAYLVKKGTPITAYAKGIVLHQAGDEYPATAPLGGFATLSGNHGSFFLHRLQIPGHGMSSKDVGGIVKNAKGVSYVIMKIVDKDYILIHPEGTPDTVSPRFIHHSKEPLFYKGKQLPFKASFRCQLYPLNRITKWQLLADGTTDVPEKKEIKCRFVDFVFVHDVVNPYYVVQFVKQMPGKKDVPEWNYKHSMCFVNTPELQKKYASYMKFPALVTYSNTFRFQPRGAVVNYRKALFHAALSRVSNLDVMFMWAGAIGNQKRQLFYIPKLKPITVKTRTDKKNVTIDLTAGYPLPRKLDVSYYIPASDALDPKDLPDRFIRVSGDEKYRYGIALGYSLFMGCTAKDHTPKERNLVYHIYRSHKMYPFASTPVNVKPGKKIETVTYRQYFDPQREPDTTSFYCHYQGKSLMVYLDFHKVLKNKEVKLPAAAAGKKITVIEKTPGVTLHTTGIVPASGIRFSNSSGHGYLVLKLD